MGQRRRDRCYPVTSSGTRHVWVRPEQPGEVPVQGYVLDWRRHSYQWSALVLTGALDAQARPVCTQTWVPIERLLPVRSDPNDGGRVRHLG